MAKLDRRKALPPLPDLTPRVGRAPQSATGCCRRGVFRLLSCEINDVESDFFALGGHSLLATGRAAKAETFNRR